MAANSEQSSPLDFSVRRQNIPSPLDLSNMFQGTSGTVRNTSASFVPPNNGASQPGSTIFMSPLNPSPASPLHPSNPGTTNPTISTIIPSAPNVFFPSNSTITWDLENLGISNTSSTSGSSSSPSSPTSPSTSSTLSPSIPVNKSNAIGPIRISKYIEIRRKNNAFVRRSRTRTRTQEQEDDLAHRTELLEQRNVQLKCQLAHIQHKIEVTKASIVQDNKSDHQFTCNWNGFR